jgi:CBS domain containing-hemolysin-like protein
LIEILLILIALALVVACGAFVAAEFAFVTVDRSSVDRAADGGDRAARGVQTVLRSLSTQLSSAQVGITLTNLLIGFLAEPSIADPRQPVPSVLRAVLGVGDSLDAGVDLVEAALEYQRLGPAERGYLVEQSTTREVGENGDR